LNILRAPAPNIQNPDIPQVGQLQGQQPQGAPAAGLPQPPGEWNNSLKWEEITMPNTRSTKSWFQFMQYEVCHFHVFLCTGSKNITHHFILKTAFVFPLKSWGSDTSQKIDLESSKCAGVC
jgi:hypothetical protein